ncbi:centrosome-associated protein ALMS1 isoform X2 [Paroedura picta]|uniref:centrosome-associated protein ALMS1 isoform X2 n=1 Tax=Paroedura picta TaxID=143630 RepID=UPI004055B9D1
MEDPEGEPGTERPGSSPAPPIATTPPRRGWTEELVSQSSSVTHLSNASGISLGEAIRHQSAVNRDMETWCQPYTEIEASALRAALGRRLGQTSGTSALMEFPTLEGGPVTPGEASRRQHALNLTHTPLLEVQDSRLSPNLPLMTTYSTQGRTFFNETLFQALGSDFAPLRGTPDVSSVAHDASRPLQTNEALQAAAHDLSSEVDCSSLSQHPFTLSTVTPSNGRGLSQYPLSFSRPVPLEWTLDRGEQSPHFVVGTNALVSEDSNRRALVTPKLPNLPLGTPLPPEVTQGPTSRCDPFLLDSTIPAPLLLEMLEKEVGLSERCGFLSSESSSCKSMPGKDPEGNEANWLTESLVQGQRGPEACATPPQQGLDSSPPFSYSEGKPLTWASLPGQLPTNPLGVALANEGHSMGDSCIISGMLPRPVLDKLTLQQASDAAAEEPKDDPASASAFSRHHTPAPFPGTVSLELGDPGRKQANALALGIQTGVKPKNVTLSGCSIERAHNYAGISPSLPEGSFFGYLAHPINHSTPGIAPARALAQKAPALALPGPSAVQPSASPFHTGTLTHSHAATCVPSSVEKPRGPSVDDTAPPYSEEPATLSSKPGAETGNSEHLQALRPLPGRMQSLPSLNFMEKVGVWNTSQSAERMSDALALQSSSGVSPRQKAYSAIADSLNHILRKQQSQMKSWEGPAATFSAGSVASLRTLDKQSPGGFPLTRSRSENSVVAIGPEASRPDAGKERGQEGDFRPAGATLEAPAPKPSGAEAEGLQAQHYTAVLVATVLSDEETGGSLSGDSDLKRFITSERVAELLREEAASAGDRGKTDGRWGDAGAPPDAQLSSSQLSMGRFSDVSPDSLNRISSSVASSCVDVRLSPRQLSLLSGESQASLEDGWAPRSPVLKSPDSREINIEERIPVYLRNLGINQSPSSILTPFLPRGPIREIEFSPSELRTMKALRQPLQASEGDSHSVVDITLSALDSSTLSVSIPAGADTGPNSSLPTNLFPEPSGDLLGQGAVECHLGEPPAPTPHPPESLSELPAVSQRAESSQGTPAVPRGLVSAEERPTKCVQVLVGRFNPKELGVSPEELSSASWTEEPDQRRSAHEEYEEGDRDSFVGSRTLKEIQELLVQAEARSPSRFVPVPSAASSSVDLGAYLLRTQKADGSGDSRSIQENIPGLQRVWSWDESLARQNVHEDTVLSKGLGFTGSLKWEGSLSGDIPSNEPIVPAEPSAASQEEGQVKSPEVPEEGPRAAPQEEQLAQSTERSEPEGCNSATGARNLPLQRVLLKRSTAGSPKESQTASAAESSGSLSEILEGFQQILEKAVETAGKGTGSLQGSENSSSVDSLGLRVKNVLRGGYPVTHAAQRPAGEERAGRSQQQGHVEPSLSFSREAVSVRGSEKSSSVDSLATRVKTLLETERPVMHAAQILQRAEEEERRALMWVKLQSAAESTSGSASALSEEDRRKIEEIKAELFLSGRKADFQDWLWENGHEGISGPFQKPEVDPNDPELHTGIRMHSLQVAEFPGQVQPVRETDCPLPRDLELPPLSSIQSYICTQLHPCADHPVDPSTQLHAHLAPDRDTCPSVLRSAPKAPAGEEGSISAVAESAVGSCPAEAAKQITSITFASRKRSPPPPPVSPGPSAGLPEAIPQVLVRLDAKPMGRDHLGPGRQLLDALNPPSACLRENAGFSPTGDGQPMSFVATGAESRQSKEAMSEEAPQAQHIEQKVHLVVENHEEAVAPSPVFAGRRGNDRSFMAGPDEKVDPGGKVAEWPLTAEREGLSGSFGGLVPDSNGLGGAGQSVLLPPSSPDRVSTSVPAAPSSPARKALSGVHITLSPKRISLDFPSLAAPEAEGRQSDVSKARPHPGTSDAPNLLFETTSKLKPSELYPPTQDSAYFPRAAASSAPSFGRPHGSEAAHVALRRSQELLENRRRGSVPDQEGPGVWGPGGPNGENTFKVTVSSQTEKLSSDAITQITTESPEKATYSAEIFVSTDNGESNATGASPWKSRGTLPTTRPAPAQGSVWERPAGKPLLLPYKPLGSSEMYYVPCPKETLRLSRVRSETTVESTHSGSNDAVPPEFPTQALGSRHESPQEAVAMKHQEGIYSKRGAPKAAWTEGKTADQDRIQESSKARDPLESVQATHSVFRSAQFYLHHPVPLQHELDFHAGSEALEQSVAPEHPAPPSRDVLQYKGMLERGQPPFSLQQPTGQQRFSPLVPEPDASLIQELPIMETHARDSPRNEAQPDAKNAGQQVAKELPLLGSRFQERQVAALPPRQTARSTDSLDELWSKYLERRQQQRDPGSDPNELSLVERLDRLARLLQNPVRLSLTPAEDEPNSVQEKGRRREPHKVRSHRKTQGSRSNLAAREEESHDATDDSRLSKSRRHLSGNTKAAGRPQRVSEQSLHSETLSGTSSEARPSKGSSVLTDVSTSESEAATQEETAPPTEVSGSVSSIDTARLIRAFGHDRVRVSPKLSQLYSAISLQRSRSEKRAKGSRRAPGGDPPPTARPEHKRKGTQATYPVSSSDSVSTPGSSRGPSCALTNKRTTRMLNKAVQAGDFEIVNSATKKHTRDVGLTFPTPTSSQTKLQGDRWNEKEDKPTRPDRPLSGLKGKPKRPPSGWLTERRTAQNKLKWLQDELKSDAKKETDSGAVPDPGPSWFEPLASTKPWREPLREKNWPEDPGGLQVRPAAPARDVENKPPPPYVKLSLQEALALRRPDFISRSGERVKRLKLIVEERKLQSVLQSEREQLFNPPEERRAYRDGLVSGRGPRALQKAQSVPKHEMVQRSKRIYEQLPEVRKRREEEKRKSDYSAYRLKAQLYKTKITNRILGRKVPWE